MRILVLAFLLAVFGPSADAFAKDAKLVKLRQSESKSDPKPAAKAPLKAKPAPKKHAAKRVVKKSPTRKKVVAKPKSKSKAKHHDDDDDDDDDTSSSKKKSEIRPMP